MTDTPKTLEQSADEQRRLVAGQGAAGSILQAYCESVERQPMIAIAKASDKLQPLQETGNKQLGLAKANARQYLNQLLPDMIGTIVSIERYYQLHSAISTEIQTTRSAAEAKSLLRALQEQTQEFQRQSEDVRARLDKLRQAFSEDSAVFQRLTTDLQVLLNGDKGVLKDINQQLSGIDGKIAGAAVGVALSGLGAILGGLMIVVGAFGSVVTGGAATAMCVGGAAVLATGVAGTAGSAVALGGLLNMKSDLLMRQATIGAEIVLVNGLSANFGSLAEGAAGAQHAAMAMANSWKFLDGHLDGLYKDLDSGKTDVPALRRIFLGLADKKVAGILDDVKLIQGQLVGTKLRHYQSGRVGDLVIEAANSSGGVRHAA